MMKKWLVTTWLVLTFMVSAEIQPLAEWQMRYQQATLLSATFTQEKHAPFISQPLVSTGYFEYAKHYGLIWAIDTPFVNHTLFTDNDLFAADESGAWMPSDNDQLNQAVADLLTELFSANFSRLDEQFDIVSTLTKDKVWRIVLTPTGRWVKKALNRLVIHGKQSIQTLELFDKDNNRTVLTFNAFKAQDEPLTTEQIQHFVHP